MKYEQIKEIISFAADSITIIGLIWAAAYGLVKKHKSLIGFRINEFIIFIFKSALIAIIGLIIFQISSYIFGIAIVMTTGESRDELWLPEYGFVYTLSYFISGAIGLALLWLSSTIIWTGSFIYCRNIWDKAKINSLKKKLSETNRLKIEKAEYKTINNKVDVTEILNKMISNNQLTITSSNDLAGDPDINVSKVLEIEYRFGDADVQTIIIPENETKTIKPQ